MRITVTLPLAALLFALGCTQNNVTEDPEMGKPFSEKNLQGTFGLFDNGHGTFTIYNMEGFSLKTHPAGSTFHIVQSLIGMETGVIPDVSTTLFSDTSADAPCDQAVDLKNAYRLHCDKWFIQLNERMNSPQYRSLLDTLGYASGKGGDLLKYTGKAFWNDTTAGVTADEQLGLVKRLYFNKLPFQKRTQVAIKELLVQEKNSNYALYYSTGGGWIIGWIEENQHPYFFALYAEENNGKFATEETGLSVLTSILRSRGFMQGKK